MNFQKMRGFTLVELMIVIVIIAILAAIAYPGYDSFIRRSRMEQAKAAILNKVKLMERDYSRNRTFAGAVMNPSDSTEFYTLTFNGTPGADSFEIAALPNTRNPNEDHWLYYVSTGGLSRCEGRTVGAAQPVCEPY